ncbi:MAG: hypothetical protein FWD21_03630, partial [Peptococcaceae bacterium]|nr:hypothetical protein [Peptococcaceae bacterium]
LSVAVRYLLIGDEVLAIYEYSSKKAMESDADSIDKSGFSVSFPDRSTQVSWVSDPYFFKKDLIIVNYVGTDESIISFLKENFGDQFAGHGYQVETVELLEEEAPNVEEAPTVNEPADKIVKAKVLPTNSLLTMRIHSVSPGGLTFSIDNPTGNNYLYGEDYQMLVRKNYSWEPVIPVIENWAFNSIGLILAPHGTTNTTNVDWRWLFGELPAGEYKFQKSIFLNRSSRNSDEFMLEQVFFIP